MFGWVLAHLKCLQRVPGLAHVFDGLLFVETLFSAPRRLWCLHRLESAMLRWRGVIARPHPFGGIEFRHGGRELGHIHSNGTLDLPFSRSDAEALRSAGRAEPHHTRPELGWVTFHLRAPADLAPALQLLRLSYRQKSPGVKSHPFAARPV